MRRKNLDKIIKIIFITTFLAMTTVGCTSDKKNNISEESSKTETLAENIEEIETDIIENETKTDEETDTASNNFIFTPLIAEESIYGGTSSENINIRYTVKYQSVILDEETAEVYPELSETLIRDKDERMKAAFESAEVFKENMGYFTESAFEGMELSDEVITSVVRSDTNVLSLKMEGYSYGGGAHGNYYTVGTSYNSKSGEMLKLNDVVKDIEKLISVTKEKLAEAYPDGLSGIEHLTEVLNNAADKAYGEEGFDAGFGWTLGYNQLELYFNPYTLASYAEGQQVVKLGFDEYPELFNEAYTENIPDAYVYKLDNYEDITYEDIDQDGENEEIRINMLYNGTGEDYPEDYVLEVSFDDKMYNTSLASYAGYENYFVKNNDGSCYVYSFTKHDNDYIMLDICKITKEGLMVSNAGNMEPAIIRSEYTDGEETENGEYTTYFNSLEYSLTNPAHLKLSSRLNSLSTYSGYRNYALNSDGFPVSETPYIIDNAVTFVLKKDFEFEESYQNGKRTGKKLTLPEGTELYTHLTDGISYIVLRYENDKYVYAEINTNEYPQLINGVLAEEILDGMFYAG
ncbi:MAG: hypothetical protein Q4B86_06625 [Eubacteriales bacterium]|nr:hypothetical protein [Eubacteriales bacterium]